MGSFQQIELMSYNSGYQSHLDLIQCKNIITIVGQLSDMFINWYTTFPFICLAFHESSKKTSLKSKTTIDSLVSIVKIKKKKKKKPHYQRLKREFKSPRKNTQLNSNKNTLHASQITHPQRTSLWKSPPETARRDKPPSTVNVYYWYREKSSQLQLTLHEYSAPTGASQIAPDRAPYFT